MGMEILYVLGLILVCLYLCTGLDDLVWDILILFKRRKGKAETLKFEEIDNTPPKLIAVVVAAWHEDNVLLEVVDNIIASQQYPKSMYHLFLGVYPNDDATVYIAKKLQEKYTNVHCVINCKDGPTTKAQNINYVISQIKSFEENRQWKFASITIHDAEDLVHPNELKVTNYLLEKYPAMQFPVFPLIKKPTLRNYFANITTATYADEFAENHYITMVGRRDSGAFVPSAGTGFSLRRDTIDVLGYDVLPEKSLTEDYKLSLTLYENGLQMHYVLEKLERIDYEGNIKREYIATRSIFPSTFKTAVKQKTRWTLGITMQSLRFKDVFNKNISFAGKYSLYRDQKAKVGNLLSMVGYPVLIYFFASLFTELPAIYPMFSVSWYLCVVVTLMMIERQIIRAISLKTIYGYRTMFFGCFFPPLIPFRIIWGNIINLVSTVKAYKQYFKGKTKETEQHEINKQKEEQVNKNSEVGKVKDNIKDEEGFKYEENISTKPIEDLAEEKSFVEDRREIIKEENFEKDIKKQDFEWSKTEHSFLEKSVLTRFHRKFGDVLISKGYISAENFKLQLIEKEKEEKKTGENIVIGKYLMNKGVLSEEQLMDILATLRNIPSVGEEIFSLYNLSRMKNDFDQSFLKKNKILPIIKEKDGYVFVYSIDSPHNIQEILKEKCLLSKQIIIGLDETINKGIEYIYGDTKKAEYINEEDIEAIDNKLKLGNIECEQVVIIRNYAYLYGENQKSVARKMGLYNE